MPCTDPDREEEAVNEAMERLRALTLALCFACGKLAVLDALPTELNSWYRAHIASDSARKRLIDAEQDVATMLKSLAKQGLSMSNDHKLIARRSAASDAAQTAYTAERKATLRLLKLIKEPVQ